MLWDYDKQQLVKSFEVSTLPVRNARFIARKQWVIASSDDLQLRVFNYNTMDKITSFDAHTDYIRYLEVHPILPIVLSCADDMTVKMWDWDKSWLCTQVFEGHGHYVMMAKFNPKDTNTFATGSLDRTVRVWGLGSSHPHFTLEGHERGVNCIDYYPGGDKPYLISGSDDRLVKVWDYQTKTIAHTLDGHTHNLADVLYHPRLPLIISACEDGAVRMWHSTTYRAETTLNYGMERAWCLAALKGSNKVAIGYDEGSIVLRLGHDTPVVSMDSTGKVIWANNNEIQTASLKGVVAELGLKDGERVPMPGRDLGSCEVYPQRLKHNSNGRFVVICGDGEYIIYTSQQLRNKSFGSALDFAWSPTGTGDYVVRESASKIVLFKNFVEAKQLKPIQCTAEGLFGGNLVAIRGPDSIAFYDWDDLRFVRKIDAVVKNVYWSDAGDLVVLATDVSYFVLRYNRDAVAAAIHLQQPDGVEGAFELLHEIAEKVGTGTWVGDCFLYVNIKSGRLNYYVGGEVMTVAHLASKMYLLGYLPKENVVFLMDKSKHVTSFTLNLVLLEYQTAVVRRDFNTANAILSRIPVNEMDNVARFLESQGFKEEALQLSTDPDQRFDLAVQLAKLDVAKDIMMSRIDDIHASATDVQHKWKQLADLALNDGNYTLAEECAHRADDLSLLLLLYTSKGDLKGLTKLATLAKEKARYNVAFVCLLLLGRLSECVSLLMDTKRLPEAAFFARSYDPNQISSVLAAWREDLAQISTQAAKALADPAKNMELFENWQKSLDAANMLEKERTVHVSALDYGSRAPLLDKKCIFDVGSGL
jgi:coatomer subunit beta'